MIDQFLSVITEELNSFLQRKFSVDPQTDKVVLANLMNQSGGLNDIGEDKIVCSLVNIQEEEVKPRPRTVKGVVANDPIFVNLTVLVAAHFSDYVTGLKFLSGVAGFFQGRQVFSPTNMPGLTGLTDRIKVDIISLETRELSSLWAMLGAKYMPSIIYRFKVITIREDMIAGETSMITEIDIDTK